MHERLESIFSPGKLRLMLAIIVAISHDSRLGLGGWAVDVFFALSGYWVTLMYRRKYTRYSHPVLAFYTSRYLRLIPVYLLCQCAMIGLLRLIKDPSLAAVNPSWVARTLAIAGITFQPVLLGPAWSLDVEVQFYLVLPLIIWLLDRFNNDRTAGRGAGVAALLLLPVAILSRVGNPEVLSTFLTFFLFGVFNAYCPWRPSVRAGQWSGLVFFAILIGLIALPATRGVILGGTHPGPAYKYNALANVLLALLFMPCLFYSVSLTSSVTDKHVGNLAYSLYLFHWIPHYAIISGLLLAPTKLLTIGAGFGLDAAFCLAIYFLLDRPADKWRARFIERYFKRTSGAMALRAS